MHASIRRGVIVCTILILGFFAAGTADAAMIDPGIYRLHNHPDGNVNPPPYGLRLDNLYDETAGNDVYTFDFDHADSAVFLAYNPVAATIEIYGEARGGRDVGAVHANDQYLGTYEFYFLYDVGVEDVPGDDDVQVDAPDHSNSGWITTPLNDTFDLSDIFMGGYTFRLGDEDNDLGHRGYAGISGWGWLAIDGVRNAIGSDDWLFTAEWIEIPEPASVLLLGMGALGVIRRRSR